VYILDVGTQRAYTSNEFLMHFRLALSIALCLLSCRVRLMLAEVAGFLGLRVVGLSGEGQLGALW